jgi:hypothetical protein
MRKLLTFLAIVFAVYSPALAQPPFESFPPGVFQNRAAIDPAPGNVPWTPVNLNYQCACVLAWWDAQDSANITLSGSNVTNWTSKIGAIAAAQATGANQPTWSATAINSTAGLTFSGAQYLTFTATGFPTGQNASTTLISADHTSSAANSISFYWGSPTTTSTQVRAYGKGTTNLGLFTNSGTNQATTETFGGTDRLLIGTFPGASFVSSLYVDGGAVETQTFTNINTAGTLGVIGAWGSLVNFQMVGILQQIVVLSIAADTNQRQCLEGWESWYDGKAGANLPGGHPYFSAAPTTANNCS